MLWVNALRVIARACSQLRSMTLPSSAYAISFHASKMADLKFTDTKAGLLVEFGAVDIMLSGLDRGDLSRSDFDFG